MLGICHTDRLISRTISYRANQGLCLAIAMGMHWSTAAPQTTAPCLIKPRPRRMCMWRTCCTATRQTRPVESNPSF